MEKLLDVFRIPVTSTPTAAVKDGDPLEPDQIKVCTFILKDGVEKNEVFFECAATGCKGAGLSCFDSSKGEIPDEILEEMNFHANFCRALWGSR